MKKETRKRKKSTRVLKQLNGDAWLKDQVFRIAVGGKIAIDELMQEVGRTVIEGILYMEREELSGPDYRPSNPDIKKWASQGGSVYVGDQKIRVERPRLRGPNGEMELSSYEQLKEPGAFSEELLMKTLCGLSGRRYHETVVNAAGCFGVSPSSVSRHIVEVTGQKLREFKERDLSDFVPFSVFLDTVHRGGMAFITALGIDFSGQKRILGFWEGASENSEVGQELLSDLESRNLKLSRKVLWVTDGGSGLIKVLKDRFGKNLIHQRCTIHKDRNIQLHLPKRFRKEAHRRFRIALEQNHYEDARVMLKEMEKWLRKINESAADSLLEAFEEILTLHRLKVPATLRKSLHSTNAIENIFSQVRHCEKNIKRYKNSKMAQRWLAAICLHAEPHFNRIAGYRQIIGVVEQIQNEQLEKKSDKIAA